MLFQISDIWGQWWKEGKKKSYFIFALQSKFYLSLLYLWIAYILRGKTNRLSGPEDLGCLATVWMAPEPPRPSRRGCAQTQHPAPSTGAGNWHSRQLTPEQLPFNLRLPDAQADTVSQLARSLSCLLYKKGKQLSGGGGLRALLLEYRSILVQLVPTQVSLRSVLRPETVSAQPQLTGSRRCQKLRTRVRLSF